MPRSEGKLSEGDEVMRPLGNYDAIAGLPQPRFEGRCAELRLGLTG